MKRRFLQLSGLMLFFLAPVLNAGGAIYTGSISTDTGTLFATSPWSDGSTLSWIVTNEVYAPYWTYTYVFTVPGDSGPGTAREISHVTIEVSVDFDRDNIIDSSPYGPLNPLLELGRYDEGNGSPDMPGEISGLKWDDTSGYSFAFTVTSDRVPMWGDFYSKAGVCDGTWVYAYNAGFGDDTDAPAGSGNASDEGKAWVLVPDTHAAPIPGSLLLLGSGLAGLGLIGFRRRKRNQLGSIGQRA